MSISRYILPFILVILSGLMYVIYIDPTHQDIISLNSKKADFEDAISKAGEVRDLQAKLLAEVEAIDLSDRDRIEKLLPASQDPILILYELNAFAQKRGLALKSPAVTLTAPSKAGGQSPQVSPVRIKFDVSAPYAVFRTFVSELERDLALKDIRSLRISSAEGQATLESSVFLFQVEMEEYSYQGKEK